ncbi:hypothetical protein NPIL_31481 [Nephila pilipes]|uniref:Uncharacterized protein n=1 Tax=Nephila pilipes TaxID=299642 RepID=A0A8X6PLB0_NEPPI|nr:hypothetical protein NPIL_31481 [Nephila pilipes]
MEDLPHTSRLMRTSKIGSTNPCLQTNRISSDKIYNPVGPFWETELVKSSPLPTQNRGATTQTRITQYSFLEEELVCQCSLNQLQVVERITVPIQKDVLALWLDETISTETYLYRN